MSSRVLLLSLSLCLSWAVLGCKDKPTDEAPESPPETEPMATADDPAVRACLNMIDLGERLELPSDVMRDEDVCVMFIVGLEDDCADAVAAQECLAKMTAESEPEALAAFQACSDICKGGAPTAAPAADLTPEERACANLARLDGKLGFGVESMSDPALCKTDFGGGIRARCKNPDPIFECVAALDATSVDSFMDAMGTCEPELCDPVEPTE